MKKIRGLLIFIILLSSLSSLNFVKEAKADSTIGVYAIERQIALSTDDVFLRIDRGYSDDTYKIPFTNDNHDIMIGLRFQNVSINPSNATYYETIESCRLSFYTTDDYPAPGGDTIGSIYGIRESGDIPTFTNYSDLYQKDLWFDYPSNQNFNQVIGSGEWFNTTDIRHVVRNMVKTDERDIGFVIYIEEGQALRLFNTFDYNSSWGVKLYITVFQWGRYESSTEEGYYSTYKGFDIFSGTDWVDYLNYTEIDPNNEFQDVNSTYVSIPNWDQDDVGKLRRDYGGPERNISLKFSVEVTSFHDASGAHAGVWLVLYSVQELDVRFQVSDNRLGLTYYSNALLSTVQYSVYVNGPTGTVEFRDATQYTPPFRHWILFEYFSLNESYNCEVYSDEFITKIEDIDTAHGKGDLDLNYEYAFNGNYNNVGDSDDDGTLFLYSEYQGFYVKDEDGNTISPELETEEEAKEWIDDYLFHYGEPGMLDAWGDTILALMGTMGLIMMPLSFWLFMANMNTDLDNAFYLLMVFFIMGLAFFITWLWA